MDFSHIMCYYYYCICYYHNTTFYSTRCITTTVK